MPALYLTEADVEQLLDMPLAIEVVEEAFRQLAAGKADNVPRQRAKGRASCCTASAPRPIIWAWSVGRSIRPRAAAAQFLSGSTMPLPAGWRP